MIRWRAVSARAAPTVLVLILVEPLIGLAFLSAVISLIGCFLCGIFAGKNLYMERRLRGALWLTLGGLCGYYGMLLFVVL